MATTGASGPTTGTSEAALIGRIAGAVARRAGVTTGIGDDAAVLDGDPPMVATVDMLVEDVHFRRATTGWRDLGRKALAVNLSDVAAMGARPVAALVGLALPRRHRPTAADIDELYAGIEDLAARAGATVAGGDVTDAPGTAVVISVTALGRMDPGVAPVLRTGARPGDVVAVTGPLGASAAGLLGLTDPLVLAAAPDAERDALLRAHRRPEARLAEGPALARAGVRAMMDVSDGLAIDARRMAEASGVGIEIDLALVPIAPGVDRIAAGAGLDADVLAATGGEDYELLVALDPVTAARIDVPLHPVGRVVDGPPGLRPLRDGTGISLPRLGWEHGA